MATCGKAARARAKSSLVHEKKRHPRKYEDTTSSLLKRNTSIGNPGLTMRFFDLVERIAGQTEGSPADRFSCFYQTWISDELPDGSQQKLGSLPH